MLFSSLTAIITMIGILSKESFTESNKKHDITFILGVLLAIPLILTKSLIAIFASLVGFSLGVYIFVMSDYRKHIAREATIKYFFLSAVSVTLILFSFSLMYAIFETTDTAVIKTTAVENSALTFLAFTFLVCGFSFKLAAYPGQLWAADVYEGSPKPVFAFFVLPSKIIIFIVFLNLLTDVFPALEESWKPLVAISCVGSLVWGGLAALYEKKIKRFMAYSSINQIGFLLAGVLTAPSLAKLYLIVYVIASLGFIVVFLQAKPELMYITDFNPMYKSNPLFGISMVIIMFTMAGIPPLAGFWGKYFLLYGLFSIKYLIVLKIALVMSIITTFYYIRIIKVMLFEHLHLPKIYNNKSNVTLSMILNLAAVGFVVALDSLWLYI